MIDMAQFTAAAGQPEGAPPAPPAAPASESSSWLEIVLWTLELLPIL